MQAALGDRQGAAVLSKQALQSNPDDWASLQLYLDAVLPKGSSLKAEALTEVEQTLQVRKYAKELHPCHPTVHVHAPLQLRASTRAA